MLLVALFFSFFFVFFLSIASPPISRLAVFTQKCCTIILHTQISNKSRPDMKSPILEVFSMRYSMVCSRTWPALIWRLFRVGISHLSLVLSAGGCRNRPFVAIKGAKTGRRRMVQRNAVEWCCGKQLYESGVVFVCFHGIGRAHTVTCPFFDLQRNVELS